MKWLVVGISGVTCGGKSTLASLLHRALPFSRVINQDDFFHPPDSEKHELITELNHYNWDTITSLDMDSMFQTVTSILSSKTQSTFSSQNINTVSEEKGVCSNVAGVKPIKAENTVKILGVPVLIMDGFLLFSHKSIADLCHLKYFFTLTKEQCWERRQKRTYDPPDVPGYFEICAWPEYVKHRDIIMQTVPDVVYLDGGVDMEITYNKVIAEVSKAIAETSMILL